MKVFALGLPLRQRRKATRKSPIIHLSVEMRSIPPLFTGFTKQNQHGQVLAVKFCFDRIKLLFFLSGYSLAWYILKQFFFKKLVLLRYQEIVKKCQQRTDYSYSATKSRAILKRFPDLKVMLLCIVKCQTICDGIKNISHHEKDTSRPVVRKTSSTY